VQVGDNWYFETITERVLIVKYFHIKAKLSVYIAHTVPGRYPPLSLEFSPVFGRRRRIY
jgi:hypothetical protein